MAETSFFLGRLINKDELYLCEGYHTFMKYFNKWIALLLMLWTPLFFGSAAYAATQMSLANLVGHPVAQPEHACHEVNTKHDAIQNDTKHPAGDAHCNHCAFCASFASPFNNMVSYVFPLSSAVAFNAKWTSSTRHITPENRPPIDA